MAFVDTLINKKGEKETFSKEKITIVLFENLCNIGEPNLNLSEKLAFLICDKVNSKFSKEITFEALDEVIKEILHKENQIDLLQAYIFKKNKPAVENIDDKLKSLVLKQILNIEESDNLSAKLINVHSHINSLQKNQHEKINKKIFEYIREGVFYPSSTFLREISHNTQFLSGYSFKIEDTIESIFETLSHSSVVQKYGSAISIDLTNIRSEKEKVKSINKNACGPVKVIDLFCSARHMVGHNINSSNNLYTLSIEHPDIISFINYSTKSNINFSILVPDRFMQALKENTDYFIENKFNKQIKISPLSIVELISSKIITGENINLIFTDNLNKKNPFLDNQFPFTISPIGFQPIFKDSSFVCGVIDVSKLVNILGNTKTFDWAKLKTIIWDSVEFLDNIIDLVETINENIYTQNIKDTRAIYLSITGFYTLLSKLDISYNSDDAIYFADSLSNYINYYSKLKSTELAKERGPFLKFIKSKYELFNFSFNKIQIQKTLFSNDLSSTKKLLKNMPVVDWSELRNNIKKYGLRNSTTFSIIFSDYYSLANETSNSINPIQNYKITFLVNGQKFEKINKELEHYVPDLKLSWSTQEIESTIPDTLKSKFPLAKDISLQFYIRLQSVFEKNTDGAVNLRAYFTDSTTLTDIKNTIIETHNIGNSLFLPKKINGNIKDLENKDNLMSL